MTDDPISEAAQELGISEDELRASCPVAVSLTTQALAEDEVSLDLGILVGEITLCLTDSDGQRIVFEMTRRQARETARALDELAARRR